MIFEKLCAMSDDRILMTPAEVAALAFGGEENVACEAVTEASILAAQSRYLRPVVGDALYARLLAGDYPELVDKWLKPPLALFVKSAALPEVSARVAAVGVVRCEGEWFSPADGDAVRLLQRRVRMEAEELLDEAVRHIRSEHVRYPEYDDTANVRCRVSVVGGVVLCG